MQFKDAAYEILKQAGEPLHYATITDRALEQGILTTSGQTPHASMGALLYTDTLKSNSRFRRGDKKGTFTLRTEPPSDIQQQINAIDSQVRKTLRKRLLKMHPQKFENLIRSLLEEMGLEETSLTEYSNDKGVDVRGTLNAEDLSQITIAVQAKRWKTNVGAKIVRELRGALKVHEHGIIITPSGFTQKAIEEADESGKTRISLIDGEQLVDLLIQHQVGVIQERYVVPVLDEEYWTEILGEEVADQERAKPAKPSRQPMVGVKFPLPIQAKVKGQMIEAQMLDLGGRIRIANEVYDSPSGAGKAVTGWKAVDGWLFWRYHHPETGEWLKIDVLREQKIR